MGRPFPYNAMKYFKMTGGRPSKYNGAGPYNNFHVSRVDFWRSKDWQSFFQAMEKEQIFMKHCVGDANVHGIAMGAFMRGQGLGTDRWKSFPVKHNSNEYKGYPPKDVWGENCVE